MAKIIKGAGREHSTTTVQISFVQTASNTAFTSHPVLFAKVLAEFYMLCCDTAIRNAAASLHDFA
uniref:Uncharacterized protein n=1 Tax=Pristionchus pacificus TaxID=54126 RepID=A0A2A6BMI1_PRIPA|eukprot:PDM67172.1 hypothetical protein PRIPAC_48589 [Pristionchus pacificus]